MPLIGRAYIAGVASFAAVAAIGFPNSKSLEWVMLVITAPASVLAVLPPLAAVGFIASSFGDPAGQDLYSRILSVIFALALAFANVWIFGNVRRLFKRRRSAGTG